MQVRSQQIGAPMARELKGIALVVLVVAVSMAGIAIPLATPGEPTTVTESNEDAPVQDIYLLIGQSNMAGRAVIAEQDRAMLDDVFVFGDGQWMAASNDPLGLNRYSSVEEASSAKTLLGPGYTFGRRLAQETGGRVGLVVNARGATSVAQWQKEGYTGDYALYDEAVRRTRAALRASPGARLRGVIWHQGESDNNRAAAEIYTTMTAEMVANLRADLDAQSAVFVAAEVGTWQGRGTYVNPEIRRIPEVVDNSAWVSSDGLTTHETDTDPWGPHFDSASQRELGQRYATATLKLVRTRPAWPFGTD